MAKKFNEMLKEFAESEGGQAFGAVAGDAIGALTSNSKYKGGQTGRAVGGGAGTIIGGMFGMPGVGQAVGGLIGGLIGGKSDENRMIDDYEDVQRKKYSKLNLSANVDPYGSDNMLYMAEGGMVDDFFAPGSGGEDDPKFKTRSLTPGEMAQWNQYLDFVKTKGYEGSTDLNNRNKNLGESLFNDFKKNTPGVTIGYDIVPSVQAEMVKLRDQSQAFARRRNDPNADKIMANISPVDGWFGSQTSQFRFPSMTYQETRNGEVVANQDLGLLNGGLKPVGITADGGQPGAAPPAAAYSGPVNALNGKPVPKGVKIEKMQDGHYYEDPQSGDWVKVKMKTGGTPRLRKFGRSFASFMQEGGMPEKEMVNIEQGEILIDPVSLDVVREYDNPNRYQKHSKNPQHEAIGNFTMIPQGQVVIPKKYAARYIKGDDLARKSIISEILKNQANEPVQVAGVPQAADGMLVEGEDPFLPATGLLPDLPVITGTGIPAAIATAAGARGARIRRPISVDYKGVYNTLMKDTGIESVRPLPNLGNTGGVSADVADAAADNGMIAAEQLGAGNEIATTGTGRGHRINKRLLASDIMTALPTAYGITNALGTDPFLRYDENTQFDSAKAYAQDMETTPNIEASKAAIRRTNSARNQILNNFNSPATRAEVAANNVAGLKAEADLIQNASNVAMDARNRKRQTLAELETQQGQTRLNMRQKLQDELRMDKANRETMVHQGLSEASTNFRQGVMDQERIRALNTMGQFYKIDQYGEDLLEDQGGYVDRVMESLGKLQGNYPRTVNTNNKTRTTDVSSTTRDRVGNVKQTKNTKIVKR